MNSGILFNVMIVAVELFQPGKGHLVSIKNL